MNTYYMLKVPGDLRPAIADVCYFDAFEGYVIHRINVPEVARGHGFGRQLLQQIIDDADKEQVRLLLAPEPSGGLNFRDLVAWYERYGFEWTRSNAMMERNPT